MRYIVLYLRTNKRQLMLFIVQCLNNYGFSILKSQDVYSILGGISFM